MTEQETTTTTEQIKTPIILYKVCCIERGKSEKIFYNDKPFKGIQMEYESEGQVDTIEEQSLPPIMIIHTARGKDISGRESEGDTMYLSKTVPPIEFGKDFMLESFTKPSLALNSQSILKVLRRVVNYYPSQTLTGMQISVEHPYSVIFHHYNELEAVKDACTGKSNPMYRDHQQYLSELGIPEIIRNEITTLELEALLNYLRPYYEADIRREIRRYNQEQPLATYQMLWHLYKPGMSLHQLLMV